MTSFIRLCTLLLLLWLGIIVSAEDWRTGKIRNKRIMQGLTIFAASLFSLLLVSVIHHLVPGWEQRWTSTLGNRLAFHIALLATPALTRTFYEHYLLHVLLVSLAGLVSWKAGCWPAGDAKFFICTGLTLPLIDPHLRFFPDRLFFVLLLNIFIPACLWFIVQLGGTLGLRMLSSRWELGIKTAREQLRVWAEKKKAEIRPNVAGYCFVVLNFFILFSISQSLRQHATHWLDGLLRNEILVFVVLFVVWDRVYGVMMRKSTTLAFLILMGTYMAAGALFFPGHILDDIVRGMGMVLRIGMLLMLVKSAINWYFVHMETRTIPVAELAQGMLLSEETISGIREDGTFYAECFQDTYTDGLTQLQALKLRQWGHQDTVTICQTKPFAFWILCGSLITLLLKMDFVNYMRMHIPVVYAATAWLFSGGGH
jgi:hypothetical protein